MTVRVSGGAGCHGNTVPLRLILSCRSPSTEEVIQRVPAAEHRRPGHGHVGEDQADRKPPPGTEVQEVQGGPGGSREVQGGSHWFREALNAMSLS